MEKIVAKNGMSVTKKQEADLREISDANKKTVAAKPVSKAIMKKKIDAAEATSKKIVAKKGNGKGFKKDPNSKLQKTRDAFKEKSSWKIDDLLKRTGFQDLPNLFCMLSIFKNKNRTKDLLITDYDKETRVVKLAR
jgi:hypothetical protein